jgi:hypothetical protein
VVFLLPLLAKKCWPAPAGGGRPQARVPSAPATARERPEALRQGVTPCQESVGDWDLAAFRDSQLLAEDVAMRLDRSGGDAELPSDLLVRVAGGDELDDLDLTFGERRKLSRQCLVHGRGVKHAGGRDGIHRKAYLPGVSARAAAEIARRSPTGRF